MGYLELWGGFISQDGKLFGCFEHANERRSFTNQTYLFPVACRSTTALLSSAAISSGSLYVCPFGRRVLL